MSAGEIAELLFRPREALMRALGRATDRGSGARLEAATDAALRRS